MQGLRFCRLFALGLLLPASALLAQNAPQSPQSYVPRPGQMAPRPQNAASGAPQGGAVYGPAVAPGAMQQGAGQPGVAQPGAGGPAYQPVQGGQGVQVRQVPVGNSPVQTTAPAPPRAPFVLTPQQQAALDEILVKWEKQSDKISTFKCKFDRWDYDQAFGDPARGSLRSAGKGQIKFKSPDHGMYRVDELNAFNQQNWAPQKDGLDHWVCDGAAIYEFDRPNKQLIQHLLPEQMKGKAIADGPLPFVFGAKADTLKRRYFLRDISPPNVAGKEIWLEAQPKFRSDAANFSKVEIILTKADFMPYAMQMYLPAPGNRTVYQFADIVLNDPLSFFKGDFAAPTTPLGWKKVVDDPAAQPPSGQKPFQPVGPPADTTSAQRPQPPVRK